MAVRCILTVLSYSFGIISGLISGFTLSALTQVDAKGSDAHDFFKWLFWLACATAMCTSLHCLLTTTFVNVFGTGLALRGPSGYFVFCLPANSNLILYAYVGPWSAPLTG